MGLPVSLLPKFPLPIHAGFTWLCHSYVGLRDVDLQEKAFLRKFGATAFTMNDVDKVGIGKVMEMALDKLNGRGIHMYVAEIFHLLEYFKQLQSFALY